jgi:hypothetical protein
MTAPDAGSDPYLSPPLDAEQLALLSRYGQERPTTAGQVLFREGDRAYDFIVVVLQATRPGRYRFGHVLHYTQSGRQYQEVIQEVVHGCVASHAPYIPVDSTEKTCLKRTKTRLLPYP